MIIASASDMPRYTIDCHQPALHETSKLQSACDIPTVASDLTNEYSLSTWRAVHRVPLSTRLNSVHYDLQAHL
jgi:hypothetical protein